MSTIESFTLLSIGIIIIVIRTWWRVSSVGLSNFQIDDILMPITAVCSPYPQLRKFGFQNSEEKGYSELTSTVHIYLCDSPSIFSRQPV